MRSRTANTLVLLFIAAAILTPIIYYGADAVDSTITVLRYR